jgi:hypothetical protein
MSVAAIQESIDELQANINSLNTLLERTYDNVKYEGIKYVKENIKNEFELAIKNNPELTKSLDINVLKEIKNEMNKIISNVDDKLPDTFEIQGLALHRGLVVQDGDTYGQAYNIPGTFNNKLRVVFAILMRQVSDVLRKYNYIKNEPSSLIGKGDYYNTFSFNKELLSVISDYTDKCKDKFNMMCKADELRKEKTKNEALELWNRI